MKAGKEPLARILLFYRINNIGGKNERKHCNFIGDCLFEPF